VLHRAVGALAALADLPLDRLDDALLAADALLAHRAAGFGEGDLRIELHIDAERSLRLRLGPLRPGGARRVLDAAVLPGAGSVLERLAEAQPGTCSAGEHLDLLISG
jgi:serine/threonine-protein kinase RsbW